MNPADLTPQRILDLACTDPTVRACVMEWRAGHVTWEQMLVALVLTLMEQKGRLFCRLVEAMERQPLISLASLTLPQVDSQGKPR